MRLRRRSTTILLPLTLTVSGCWPGHAIDTSSTREKGGRRLKGSKEWYEEWEDHREYLLPKSPPLPHSPPSYAPQELIATVPPTAQSPIQQLPTPISDDASWGGKGKGSPPQVPPGKGKGAPEPPPIASDDKYSTDDSAGGKGKGAVPPPPPGKGKGSVPAPPGKGGKGSKGSKYSKKKDEKSSKSMFTKSKMSKTSLKSGSSKSLGKGKGKGFWTPGPSKPRPPTPKLPTKPTCPPSPPPASGPCFSSFSAYVMESVPELISKNPSRCCGFDGPTTAVITHAQPDNSTASGFEPFWNNMYDVIDAASKKSGVCFFMTGYNPGVKTGRNLSEVLIDANQVVSGIAKVPSMMSTDPTNSTALVTEIRKISSNPSQPSIGVFNAGYENIQLEKLVSGLPALPFVGYTNDQAYGQEAALATRELLGSETPMPLCLNARQNVSLVGARCQAYYSSLQVQVDPASGVNCNSSTTPEQIVEMLLSRSVNAAWSHIDCCSALSKAAESVVQMGRDVVVGCMDEAPANATGIDFVTRQPETLQAYATSTWANFPVIQELRGRDGRAEQFFPSLSSLVNTSIFNMIFT